LGVNRVFRRFGFEVRRFRPSAPSGAYAWNSYYALRSLHFYDLLSKIQEVPGSIVECGVASGQSLFTLALYSELFPLRRSVWGFDSFEGLPSATEADHGRGHIIQAGQFASTKGAALARMQACGLKVPVRLVKGWFPKSFPEYDAKEPIALLHLDVDLYQSYKDCLTYFYPLVARGGDCFR
jgi:O-methyltransferase